MRRRVIDETILDWPLALAVFLGCNSVISVLFSGAVNKLLTILVLALPLMASILNGHMQLKSKWSLAFVICYLVAIVPLMAKALAVGNIASFLYVFLVLFPFFMLYFATRGKGQMLSLLYKFEVITLVSAVISLFFWLFGEILDVIPYLNKVTYEWGGQTNNENYFFLHFGAQGTRNCGLFVEAPMFNMVLCTSLLIELFLKPKMKMGYVVLLIVTILTSRSTTGQLLIMGALFVKYFVLSERKLSVWAKIGLALGTVVVAAVVLYVGFAIMKEKSGGDSFAVRAAFMLKELMKFKSSPIWGVGHLTCLDGTSNSFTLTLAEGGLLQMLINALPILWIPWKVSKESGQKEFKYFAWFFFYLFAITAVPYNQITGMMIGFGFAYMLMGKDRYLEEIRK